MRRFAAWVGTGALAGLMLAGATGCGAGASDSPEVQLPSHVRVSIVDATVGVGKMDREQWDGPGQVSEELLSSVASTLLRRNAYVAIGEFLTSLAIDLFERPDPTGWAELLNGVNPVSRVVLKATQEDTLTPQWRDVQGKAPSFARVPLGASTRIHVQLVDDDSPLSNDPMGGCELNYQDLVEALQAQQVYHVNVAEQTRRQILFLGISVIPDGEGN